MYKRIFRGERRCPALTHLERAGITIPALATLIALPLQVAGAQGSVAASGTSAPEGVLQEIMVSARRVNESILDVPVSITVLGSESLETLGVRSFMDYGLRVPNLAFQYGASDYGYADNRAVTIRGVQGNRTTGFYIDDTPVSVALDPQVVDVERIEVLKGPQGTLYGAGSMGGNVRIVTRQPVFDNEFSYTVSGGYTSHADRPDGRFVAMGNLSLIDGVAALRAVGVSEYRAGFITRVYPDRLPGPYEMPPSTLQPGSAGNQGAKTTYGGSVSLLVNPTDDISILARVMGQYDYNHGRAVQYAPLPNFEPLDSYRLKRLHNVQEWSKNAWFLPSLQLTYTGSSFTLTSSTSYYEQHLDDAEDDLQPDLDYVWSLTGVALEPPCCQTSSWHDDDNLYEFNQELRLATDQFGPFRAVVGVRYSRQYTIDYYLPAYLPGLAEAGLWPSDLMYTSKGGGTERIDKSVFGETYWRMGKLELTLGARLFELETKTNVNGNQFTDGFIQGGFTEAAQLASSESGVSPKAALSYDVAENSLLYVSASKGFRPGAPQNPLPGRCDEGLRQLGFGPGAGASYESDDLWNYEVGGKTQVGRMFISAAAFRMDWTAMQQVTEVPICFLNRTLNVGDARITGAEVELAGELMPGLQGQFGIGYQKSKLLAGGTDSLPVGSRLVNSPEMTGTAALTYTRPLTSIFEGYVSTDYGYVGSSLSNSSGHPQKREGYGLWNARFGVRDERYHVELYAKNITNEWANLGDIYLDSTLPRDQNGDNLMIVAIPTPRQFGMQFTHRF